MLILPFILDLIRKQMERRNIKNEMGEAIACGDTARALDLLDELQGED